jgi:hypothetical protein
VSPYPIPVLELLKRHYIVKYGLEAVASESFSGTDSVTYPTLGQGTARDAIARTDKPEIEVFIVLGGNFPTMSFVFEWERAIGKPIITSNQAALWAMVQIMRVDEKLPGLGRLLDAGDVSPRVAGRITVRRNHPVGGSIATGWYFHPPAPLFAEFKEFAAAILSRKSRGFERSLPSHRPQLG